MKKVCKSAARVLEALAEGLRTGGSRKVDESGGAFMAVHVERLRDTPFGAVYSVAHYYEQHGDLVPDPDVTLLRDPSGGWYPLTYEDAYGHRVAAEVNDGDIRVRPRAQADLARFLNLWMRNVREQQGVG